MNTYGNNKASDRKALKGIFTTIGLMAFIAAVVNDELNKDVTLAVTELTWVPFLGLVSEVLKDQTSGQRGRPALEEKPIHTMLKAIREAMKVEDLDKSKKLLAYALKTAAKEEEHLVARRAQFKPSVRIQGARRLPGLLNVGENAKS
jgi:hypothetical protein